MHATQYLGPTFDIGQRALPCQTVHDGDFRLGTPQCLLEVHRQIFDHLRGHAQAQDGLKDHPYRIDDGNNLLSILAHCDSDPEQESSA